MGRKDKQRKRLRDFAKLKEKQRQLHLDQFIATSDNLKNKLIATSQNSVPQTIDEQPTGNIEDNDSTELTPLLLKKQSENHIAVAESSGIDALKSDTVEEPIEEEVTSLAHQKQKNISDDNQLIEEPSRPQSSREEISSSASTNEAPIVPHKKIHSPSYGSIEQRLSHEEPAFTEEVVDLETNNRDISLLNEPQLTAGMIFLFSLLLFTIIFDFTLAMMLSTTSGSHVKQSSNSSWIIASYLITMYISQLLTAQVSGKYKNYKTLSYIGTMLFLIGSSILTIKTVSFWWIVMARFILGLASGSLIYVMLTIINKCILNKRFSRPSMKIFTIPIVGGLSLAYATAIFITSWQNVYFLLAIFSFFTLFLIMFYFPSNESYKTNNTNLSSIVATLDIDLIGCTILSVFLLLIAVITTGNSNGFSITSPYSATLVISIILVGILLLLSETTTNKNPIIPLDFIENKVIFFKSLTVFFASMSLITFIHYFPFYLEKTLNISLFDIYKRTSPMFLTILFIIITVSRRISTQNTLSYGLVTFFGIMGLIGQCILLNYVYNDTADYKLWKQCMIGILPILGSTFLVIATLMDVTDDKKLPIISTSSFAVSTLGSILGICISGFIFNQGLYDELWVHSTEEKGLGKIIRKMINNSEYESSSRYYCYEILESYFIVSGYVFLFSAICLLVAVISFCFTIKNKRHH
ncbi:Vba4p NDAI_0J01280 [Naumovozyma dairenensis CBS 421]|uniref:Major facilitator superfamily (MFS) profile domain-containing protein n=1 Tax=Naumovozyma dairenensis (strain ATCC 10597 / BCRC 20456 / CBS 421 / NBRC 0211 / NRRL Y-12639) TaxID=1071378 RepID=G0WGU2_NAUDC|nr:hypothetical protein NDAI_0J01280 [Naumovozyma dairenensis CBS 421]CCD27020.1 hypothetical protein NDAI_0J01280 [Naumovozyma dairenensis CBS 421]